MEDLELELEEKFDELAEMEAMLVERQANGGPTNKLKVDINKTNAKIKILEEALTPAVDVGLDVDNSNDDLDNEEDKD